jgi:hypothetical protein
VPSHDGRALEYSAPSPYREKCDEVAANGYEGFAMSKSAHTPPAKPATAAWG